jgi:O-antigen/teichoic acid export membrane protein
MSGHLSDAHGARAIRAIGWSVGGQIAVQIVRFAFGVALARLLSPRDFGLVAMVTVLTQFATAAADLGFEDALVHERVVDEEHLSSVFWAMLVAGGALALLTVGCAPWIAAFYDVERLRSLAAVLSPLFVLRGLGAVPRALIARRLDFRRSVQIECAAAAVGGSAAVVLAWRGLGATSLAVQLLVAGAVEVALLYPASGWRPRLRFRLRRLGELLGFSGYRLATRMLGYWSQHVDELLVGRLLGVTPLGLYTRACNLIRFPVLYVSRATARVMFPSLAEIRDDPPQARELYQRLTGVVALATVPMSLGLLAAAEPFVLGVLGPHWREVIPLVRILGLAGLVQGVTTLSSSLFLSQGRPDLHLRLNVLQTLAMVAAVLAGRRWGIEAVALAYAVASVAVAAPTLELGGRLVGLGASAVLGRIAPVLAAGAGMTLVVLALEASTAGWLAPLGRLALEVGAGGLTYAGLIRLLRARPYLDLLGLLQRDGRSASRARR